jgi:hypothetical protein
MKLHTTAIALFLTCFALQATPIITPDGIPLSVLDPGIGRPIIGIPGSTWDIWGNDNWANTGPGIHGDFDFNDGHGTLEFLVSGVAQWLGSNAGHNNEFIVAGVHINASTPGPLTFTYTPNVELIIQFRDLTAGNTFYSGPAARNADGAPHVWTENVTETPEPTTWMLVGLGLVSVGWWRKRHDDSR